MECNFYILVIVYCNDNKIRKIKIRDSHVDIKLELIRKKFNIKKEIGLQTLSYSASLSITNKVDIVYEIGSRTA